MTSELRLVLLDGMFIVENDLIDKERNVHFSSLERRNMLIPSLAFLVDFVVSLALREIINSSSEIIAIYFGSPFHKRLMTGQNRST